MKGLMEFLAKAKLIDLSEDERTVLPPAGEASADAPGAAAAEVQVAPVPVPEGGIDEGVALDDIFGLAEVPPSPFPAEKLLRLLDGLRAMDAATRKAAVLAMDAAEDSWQITDPLLDAQRKIAAIEAYKKRLAAQVAATEEQVSARIVEGKAALERTIAEIRAQIAELEQLLEREVARAAQESTGQQGDLRATREAAARELRRMDKEIERFAEIPASFSQQA